MSVADLILKESGILDESKELDSGLAFRSKKFSKGSAKEGEDEVGAIYNPFSLRIPEAPIGDREKYVIPIAFTSGNFLYFYLMGEQPNSKTGVKVDTLFKKLVSGASTVAALKNVLDSANTQFYDLEANRLGSPKHFKKYELKDEASMNAYYETEQAFAKFGISPKPAKIIVGWKNESNPLDQKDIGVMQATILLNRTEDGNIGKTSYKVRFTNAADGGTCRVSSIHRFTNTNGAGSPYPASSSEIQNLVDSQPSGTDFSGTGGGSRVRGSLAGKEKAKYTLVVANKGNFKGIMDTGVYKHGDSAWQTAIDLILKSLPNSVNENEKLSSELQTLLEKWEYFDWNDEWKYNKWLIDEYLPKGEAETAIKSLKKMIKEGKQPSPKDSAKVLTEAVKVMQECITALDENALNEGFLDTLKGKAKQLLGKASGTANWMDQYEASNKLKTCEFLAITLVRAVLSSIQKDELFNAATIAKQIFASDPKYKNIFDTLKGQETGLKPALTKLSEMYAQGGKQNINELSTDDDINRKLNLQGYVAKVADLIKQSAYGKAAIALDSNSKRTLGGAQRKGKFIDVTGNMNDLFAAPAGMQPAPAAAAGG